MSSFGRTIIAGILLALTAGPGHAQRTFESHGFIRSIDPVLRIIDVGGEQFRIDEEVLVRSKGKTVPAMIAIEPGNSVSFSGVILTTGEKLIESLTIGTAEPASDAIYLQSEQE